MVGVRSARSVCEGSGAAHRALVPGLPGTNSKEGIVSIEPPKGFFPEPLSNGWNDPYEPPVTRWLPVVGGKPLFYPGELHLLYGKGGCGKTWLALLACLMVARDGFNALFIDYEGAREVTRYRLKAMGATEEEASRIMYVKAEDVMDRDMVAQLTRWLLAHQIQLVAVDSLSRALAASDLDETNNRDVIGFFAKMEPLRASGAAICFIDHIGHPRADVDLPSPRGASAKVDQVAVAYYVRQGRTWSSESPGQAKVFTRKDRHGTTTEGSVIAVLAVTPRKHGLTVTLEAPAPPAFPGVDDQEAAQCIADLLDDETASRSKSAMVKAVMHALGCNQGTADTALDQMIASRHVKATSNGNGSATMLARPTARPAAA